MIQTINLIVSIESISRLVHFRNYSNLYIDIRISWLFFIEITASLNKEHFCFSSFYLTHIYLFMRRCNSDREEGRRQGVFCSCMRSIATIFKRTFTCYFVDDINVTVQRITFDSALVSFYLNWKISCKNILYELISYNGFR